VRRVDSRVPSLVHLRRRGRVHAVVTLVSSPSASSTSGRATVRRGGVMINPCESIDEWYDRGVAGWEASGVSAGVSAAVSGGVSGGVSTGEGSAAERDPCEEKVSSGVPTGVGYARPASSVAAAGGGQRAFGGWPAWGTWGQPRWSRHPTRRPPRCPTHRESEVGWGRTRPCLPQPREPPYELQ
jgi:hypothetical protein